MKTRKAFVSHYSVRRLFRFRDVLVLRLKDLQLGSRLLYRSRENWRTAAIARITDDYAILTVCSPKGRTYRLKREIEARVAVEGSLLILCAEAHPDEHWKGNYGNYDTRW